MTHCSLVLVLFILVWQNVDGNTRSCRELIKKHYPTAKCTDVNPNHGSSANMCLKECEHFGELECQGKRGKIQRLNCKRSPSTCCCNISCEATNSTLARLEESLVNAKIIQNSYKCISAFKSDIKEKLKSACRKDLRVQIARKYCLEERLGTYYCLKDGKCFGNLCKGCVKHECEINGTKQILNPPDSYAEKLEASGFKYESAIGDTINVEDKANLRHERKWCTMISNLQASTFDAECQKICAEFGVKMCNSEPEKTEPTNECKGGQNDCKCCCQPSCDEAKMPLCALPPLAEATTEDCADDGMALSYDNYGDYSLDAARVTDEQNPEGIDVQVSETEEKDVSFEEEEKFA